MDRRSFVAALAASLAGVPPIVRAQPARARRIGFLSYATPEQSAELLREFTEGLRQLGYVDRRTLVVEPLYGDGTQHRLDELAAEIVRSRVDVIVTGTNPIAAAAKRATATIPIVMVGTRDPVGAGLVADLARPGANVTGLCVDASAEMSGKFLGLLKEIVPGLARVGLLNQQGYRDPEFEIAARKLNVELHVVEVRRTDDVEAAFDTLRKKGVGAVVVRGSLYYVHRQQVADLALKHRLPAIHALKEYAQVGLLMTYGPSLPHLYRRAAGYVDRIVKGAKPGDLPVEQPTTFELVINLATAKALGLSISPTLLVRADQVIR